MNHSEVLEIRKRFTKTAVSAHRVTGCYVTGDDKQIRTYVDEMFLNLEEEEQFKYMELMKKSLSGTMGKNLLNLSFTNEAELEGGVQRSLIALRDSELKNQEMLDSFYLQVIENYDFAGNYLILLVYDAYDVPVKTEDNIKLGDSEEVYAYVLCMICPVNLSKPGLSYHEEENRIANRTRDWVVEMPETAFLFPAFNDRSTDLHNLLYYVKDTDELHEELISGVLGCGEKLPSDKQKKAFKEIVTEVLNEVPEYDTFEIVKAMNDTLTEMTEDLLVEEPVMLNKDGVKELFLKSGLKEEHLEVVEEKFTEAVGAEAELEAESLTDKKKFEVKTNDVHIQVKPENSDLIEVRILDGRKCLVIPMDVDVEVNGIVRRIREEFDVSQVEEEQ